MLLELDDSQKKTVKHCLDNEYSIVAAEMGYGKTAVMLATWEILGGKLLVVCPSYLIENWKDEILKFLGPEIIVTAVGSKKEIYELIDTDVCLISYDLAAKPEAECLFEWADLVIADEAHLLKTMEAKRTEAFHKNIYENSIKRLYLLSGTPIKNRVKEYYSLMALMNYKPGDKPPTNFLSRFPDQFEFADKFSFREQYQMPIWRDGDMKIVTVTGWKGLRNVKLLKKYLKGFYTRGRALNLPGLYFKDILVSSTKDKELLAEFNEFCGENTSVQSTHKKDAALMTAPFTAKYAEDLLETEDCIVVFTDHVDACELIAGRLGVPALSGSTATSKARARAGKRFQAGELRAIVATIASFSAGVNLTRASNLILNDPPWVPGDLDQAIKRIHRKTQTRKCWVHRIHGSPQSKYIYTVLEEKSEVIKRVQRAMEKK